MGRRAPGRHWRQRQGSDPYVARARAEGWRSRAVYKLMEIQERYRVLRPGALVVDLGAAPGGWSQYAAGIVGERGRVIAVDLLEMDPIPGVDYIQGDFRNESTLAQVLSHIGEEGADLVMSDLAPNVSGIRSVDQPRAIYLAELALELAGRILKPGGSFIVKLFHGAGFDEFVREARRQFRTVRVRKPGSSRRESRETYLVATGRQV